MTRLDSAASNSRRKVLHVFGPLRPSGMERMLAGSAQAWNARGWDIVAVGEGEHNPYGSELESVGVKVRVVSTHRTLRGINELRRTIRAERPDVVHIHVEGMHGPLALAARLGMPRGRLVRTIHSIFQLRGTRRVVRWFQTRLFRLLGGRSVAPSEAVARNELEFWGVRTRIVENWVDDSFQVAPLRTFELTSERLTVTLLGNCSPIKRHELVLSAALASDSWAVVHQGVEAGASTFESSLVFELDAKGRIEMVDPHTPVQVTLERGSVFAFSSEVEGFGIALAEALCLGRPCLVSASPGLEWAAELPGTQLVDDAGWAGALLQFEQAPTKLVDLYLAARGNALHIRERFSMRRGVDEYERIYLDDSR